MIRAGVKMVNAELGGVNGHPLQLSECFWAQAEEEGIRCGQQMVNDKVKTIIFGFVTVPNQAIYATVRGTIPITGVITASPADPTAKNAYFLNGSQTTGIGAFGTYTRRFPQEREDRDRRLSDLPGRYHGCCRRQDRASGRWREVTISEFRRSRPT